MNLQDFTPDPRHLADMLAGAAGGAVRWAALKLSFSDGLLALVIGSICALYLAPLGDAMLASVLGKIITDNQSLRLGGFVIGVTGIASFGFVIEFIRLWRSLPKGGAP